MSQTLTVNGKVLEVAAPAGTPLLWVLRDELGMTGTKFGCGRGLCGSCTVLANDDAIRSCSVPLADVTGKRITTIQGRALGFAAWWSFFSYAAMVADVSIEGGVPRVHAVVAAVDCGTPVNPDGIAAQIEGCIAYGLSAALYDEITIEGGAVQQSNFDDYPLLTINTMPVVEVHIVPSTAAPSGTGEPGLPPIAPAVTNALFALTGKRVRSLPVKLSS